MDSAEMRPDLFIVRKKIFARVGYIKFQDL